MSRTQQERIDDWTTVCNDDNWDGCKDPQYMASNYGDDELDEALALCGQDLHDPSYDDGR